MLAQGNISVNNPECVHPEIRCRHTDFPPQARNTIKTHSLTASGMDSSGKARGRVDLRAIATDEPVGCGPIGDKTRLSGQIRAPALRVISTAELFRIGPAWIVHVPAVEYGVTLDTARSSCCCKCDAWDGGYGEEVYL